MKPATIAILGIAAGLAAIYVATKGTKAAAEAVKTVAEAVNPLNHDNVFAKGVNAVGGALVTDPAGPGKNADGSWSLGGWWHDVVNPGTAEALRNISQPVPVKRTSDANAQLGDAFTNPFAFAFGA